jgi:hypothetical protein
MGFGIKTLTAKYVSVVINRKTDISVFHTLVKKTKYLNLSIIYFYKI